MLEYLAVWSLPQFSGLPKRQRRFVWRQCVLPIKRRPLVRFARASLPIAVLLIILAWHAFASWNKYLVIGLVCWLASEALDLGLLLLYRTRETVAQYILAHAWEIQSAR